MTGYNLPPREGRKVVLSYSDGACSLPVGLHKKKEGDEIAEMGKSTG
jgi:hypothetical protein